MFVCVCMWDGRKRGEQHQKGTHDCCDTTEKARACKKQRSEERQCFEFLRHRVFKDDDFSERMRYVSMMRIKKDEACEFLVVAQSPKVCFS